MPPLCLARLTSWERTNTTIGTSNKRCSVVKLCKNVRKEECLVCEDCSSRPIDGKYQTRMLHGTLLDAPQKESHIYGSSWYWTQVALYGDPFDIGWMEQANEAQRLAEERCVESGFKAWRVQRPNVRELEEMRVTKQKKDQLAAANRIAKKEESVKGTLLNNFVVPIKTYYEESEKSPETMSVDTCSIWKEEINGHTVWVTSNGMIFDVCKTTGEPSEFLCKR